MPPQLQELTYAEQVMITRVRHNRCVIRVNPGRVRMHENAIMFARPASKVYPKLPPSRDEISEVLAFIFTGSAALLRKILIELQCWYADIGLQKLLNGLRL